MTTLLKHAFYKIMGAPGSDGRWECPECGSRNLQVMPHRAEYKDRYRCWSAGCDFRGDIFDLMLFQYPNSRWPERQAHVDKLTKEFEASGGTVPSSPGRGIVTRPDYQFISSRDIQIGEESDEAHAAESVVIRLAAEAAGNSLLPFAEEVLRVCSEYGLHPAVLRSRIASTRSLDQMLVDHAAICDDPDCGDDCRAMRGLRRRTPPERRRFEHEAAERRAQRVLRRRPGCVPYEGDDE